MSLYLKNIIAASGIALFSTFIISWDKNDSNKSHAHHASAAMLKAADIDQYAESLNKLVPSSLKLQSMVYMLGDYSFRVSKYLKNGQPFLYVESGYSKTNGTTERRYYLKDNKLVYLTEHVDHLDEPQPFVLRKLYFANASLINAEQKSAETPLKLEKTVFRKVNLSSKNYVSDLDAFEDAINRRNDFDLTFEGIAECPKAKYLIFSNTNVSGYKAPVRVQSDDELIRELSANPERYRGEKIDINWSLNDKNEVVYLKGKLRKN